MSYKFFNGRKWRRCSEAEARYRRAHGQDVVDDMAKPAPVKPQPVKSLDDLPPAPAHVALDPFFVPVECPEPTMPVSVPIEESPVSDELSDDELERLTAPSEE